MNLRQNFVFYELCVHPVWFLISSIPSPNDLWLWDLPELPSVTQNCHLKKHTVSCWNRIVCMHKNYLSVLFLFIRKCYAMVFYVLQTVNICISKDIRCTEPTHLDLPNAFSHLKVQGMSFIAAVLILNLEEADAFIAFANLLNKPCQLAFFRVDHSMVCTVFWFWTVTFFDLKHSWFIGDFLLFCWIMENFYL